MALTVLPPRDSRRLLNTSIQFAEGSGPAGLISISPAVMVSTDGKTFVGLEVTSVVVALAAEVDIARLTYV